MADMLIAAMGDVLVDRAEPASAMIHVGPLLEQADSRFCNFEGVLTDRHAALPGAGSATIVASGNVEAVRGIETVSLANNHVLDAGYGGLSDTIRALESVGCTPVGAGTNAKDAWRPALRSVGQHALAVIAVTAVLPKGWSATSVLPGVASLRARDYYAPRHPSDFCPGVLPLVMSVADEEDWKRLENEIQHARREADFVVVSMHWGDYAQPYKLTEFERMTARRLAQLDVDLVVGHHHHCMRGAEIIGRTPVLYGLGNLVFDHPGYIEELKSQDAGWLGLPEAELERRFGRFGIYPRDGGFPFNDLARLTAVAMVRLRIGAPAEVAFAPAHIAHDGTPAPIARGSGRWNAWMQMMERCMDEVSKHPCSLECNDGCGKFPIVDIRPAE